MTGTILRIRKLRLSMMIGILPQERLAPQTVEISIDMQVDIAAAPTEGAQDYVSYAPIVEHLIALSDAKRHIDLVEQLANEVFEFVFADPRVRSASVEIMKPEIFEQADAVGIRIARENTG